MASNQELPKFRFGIRNLIILMVAGSFWLAAIFSNSNALAFAFSFICFLSVILGSTTNLLGKKYSEHSYWFYMVSTLLTAFILMIMIAHQINVARNFEEYESVNVPAEEYPGPAKITSDDHVQVWRWGLIWLPVCLLFAWLVAFPAALAFKQAGISPPGSTPAPPDIQFLDTPADEDPPDRP